MLVARAHDFACDSREVLEKSTLQNTTFKKRPNMKRYGFGTYLMTSGVKDCYYEL